jgi:type II restriction enzyme
MNLRFDASIAVSYRSKSQIARVLTEHWVEKNVYCPSCGNQTLSTFANNLPVADFYCPSCMSEYELKSKKDSFSSKIVDGAFETMIDRINSDNNPHFFFMNYSNQYLEVKNFLVIPRHYFIDYIKARRAGWVGCNILLHNIPESGKVFFVKNGLIRQPDKVIADWAKTAFLADQKKESRGWTIEIMRILDQIKNDDFTLNEIYAFETDLKRKFPKNNFIKDKIRQQLQILRDKGLIAFKGRGSYAKL